MLSSSIRAWRRASKDHLLPGKPLREVTYDGTIKHPPVEAVEWQRPLFPQGCPCSIIGVERLNSCVPVPISLTFRVYPRPTGASGHGSARLVAVASLRRFPGYVGPGDSSS